MAGTTRLELATSAVTEFTRWTQRNQSDTVAVVGNRWLHWARSAWFCATVCATPPLLSKPRGKVQLRLHLCRGDRHGRDELEQLRTRFSETWLMLCTSECTGVVVLGSKRSVRIVIQL